MIHVCFGLHDGDGRYSKFTGTTITSIFANTSASHGKRFNSYCFVKAL